MHTCFSALMKKILWCMQILSSSGSNVDSHGHAQNWFPSAWWPSFTFTQENAHIHWKQTVSPAAARLWRELKVQHVELMEKLIRGQSSHPNLLTHFHPSHYVPLLPLSVTHSPTAVNELILSHTLCLQLYLFCTLQCRKREIWVFAPMISPIRYL